ncbi:hypothetical protein BGX28_009331 [Mortierella sp. GBA30]|nr:hypothetical protein BGX28_009331 [Mortierella sp. GBA30]
MAVIQNDAFKKFSKDLQEALVIPVNFLNKKTKRTPLSEKKKPSGLTMTGLERGSINNNSHHDPSSYPYSATPTSSATDSVSLHNFSLSTISKSSDDNQSFTSTNGLQHQLSSTGQHHHPQQQQQQKQRSRANSFIRSPLSPTGMMHHLHHQKSKVFPKLLHPQQQILLQEEQQPALVHCPPSVASLDQFSSERQAWVRNCLAQNQIQRQQQQRLQQQKRQGHVVDPPSDILKSERAWDTIEGQEDHQKQHQLQQHIEEQGQSYPAELIAPGRNYEKSGYNNLNEATGLVLVKLMQVSNRASSKIFDIECSLRIGNVERTSHPSRSFKDSPGNTATMNEVFLFDVNGPFQLELDVTAVPVATKFGTIAGFTNTQTVHLGQLHLPLALQSMEKSVRTYKLQRVHPSIEGSLPSGVVMKTQAKEKADCEIVIMIGVHVLKEPVEDRSWETETLYQGNLTVMTRGSRMAAWKRYWAVLEGSALKLYDAEYQLKREPIAIIPLAHVLSIQPPDYDKVDVGANGFTLDISRSGVDMAHAAEFDLTDMDYHVYAFTDSPYLLEIWKGHLEEALDQYRENLTRREEFQDAKRRRRRQSASASTNMGAVDADDEEEQEERLEMVDLRFVS